MTKNSVHNQERREKGNIIDEYKWKWRKYYPY